MQSLHERTLKDTEAELRQAFEDEDYHQACRLFEFYVYKYELCPIYLSPVVVLLETAGSSKTMDEIEARLKRVEALSEYMKQHKNLMLVLEAYACLYNAYPFSPLLCRAPLELMS